MSKWQKRYARSRCRYIAAEDRGCSEAGKRSSWEEGSESAWKPWSNTESNRSINRKANSTSWGPKRYSNALGVHDRNRASQLHDGLVHRWITREDARWPRGRAIISEESAPETPLNHRLSAQGQRALRQKHVPQLLSQARQKQDGLRLRPSTQVALLARYVPELLSC